MILLLFSLFFSSANSNEISIGNVKGNLQTISAINKNGLIQPILIDCAYSLFDETKKLQNSRELFNQCAVDLCGPPSENKSVWLADENFTQNLSPATLKKVEKENATFQKLFSISQKNKLKELEQIKEYLSAVKDPLQSLSDKDKDGVFEVIFSPYISIKEVDSPEPNKKLEFAINPPTNSSKEFITALSEYASSKQTTYQYDGDFLRRLSQEELQKIALQKIEEIKKSSNFTLKDNEVIDGLQSRTNMASNKIETETIIRELKNFDEKQRSIGQKTVFPKTKCESNECQTILKDFFIGDKAKDNLATYERSLKDPQTLFRSINTCKANIIINEAKKSDATKMNAVFKEAKSAIKNKFLPHFSEHSRGIMLNFLDKKLEASNQNIRLVGAHGSLNYFKHQAAEYISFNNSLNPGFSKSNAWSKMNEIQNSIDSMEVFSDVYPCHDLIGLTAIAWDTFTDMKAYKAQTRQNEIRNKTAKNYDLQKMSDSPQVFVSDFSCQHADHGKFNVAHEIGHALNYLFRTQKLSPSSLENYKNLRQCVINAQPLALTLDGSIFPSDKSFPFEKLYTEEDMADFIAAISTKDDEKLYACAFLKQSNVKNAYANLKFSNGESYDRHSPDFVRVLFEAISKGKRLPETCKTLLKEESHYINFNKCEL